MTIRTRTRQPVRTSRAERHGWFRLPGSALATVSLVAGTLIGGAGAARADEVVHIPDAALLACVNEHIDSGRTPDEPVSDDELTALTGVLVCESRGIEDLTGLEYATSITDLRLSLNQVSDLEPIRGLTQLRQLYLDGNPLGDIDALSGMTQLHTLYANDTGIADITPLSELQPVDSYLGIQLDRNSIVDLSPLQGTTINTLSTFADQTRTLSATVGEPVPNPVIGFYGEAVPPESTDFYDAATNSFVFTEAAASHEETWKADYGGIFSIPFTGTLVFEIAEADPVYVDMPDPDLRDCVAWELGVDPDDPFTQEQMETVIELDCAFFDIRDLTGIEHAANLEVLYLDWNEKIGLGERGIEPLSGLTELRDLSLWLTNLSDLSALAGLTKLETLDIESNLYDSAQLHHLAGLTQLEVLSLSDSYEVDDLAPIAGLTGLRELYAQFLPVTSVEPLAGMTELEVLYLNYGTAITDLTPLVGLSKLTDLALDDQRVRLPDVVAGQAEPNPVRTVDGSPVPSDSEFYDSEENSFVFTGPGQDVRTSWSTEVTIGEATATFSGTLTRDVSPAPSPAPEHRPVPGGLPATGSRLAWPAGAAGALLLISGAMLLGRRPRREHTGR